MMTDSGAKMISRQNLVAIHPIRARKNDLCKAELDDNITPLIRILQWFPYLLLKLNPKFLTCYSKPCYIVILTLRAFQQNLLYTSFPNTLCLSQTELFLDCFLFMLCALPIFQHYSPLSFFSEHFPSASLLNFQTSSCWFKSRLLRLVFLDCLSWSHLCLLLIFNNTCPTIPFWLFYHCLLCTAVIFCTHFKALLNSAWC